MSEQNIFAGTVIGYIGKGKVLVWIPMKSGVPLGMAKWLYRNTGSVIDGNNLSFCENSAYVCRMMLPVQNGGWWNPLSNKSASYFGNGYRDGEAIPNYPSLIDKNGIENYNPKHYPNIPFKVEMPQALGAASYSAAFTLQTLGGDVIPQLINPPKGDFKIPTSGHRVLVAFYDQSISPAVIGILPYEEEYEFSFDKINK